jgi:hypothetical protein
MKIFEESVLDNKTLYFYILIFIGILFAFSTINIKLNLVYATIIATFVIYYLYNNYREKQDRENKIESLQEGNILPKPANLDKYNDIVKYLFSIQDFYNYNPEAYEEMIYTLGYFFQTYEETINNESQAGRNHGLMIASSKKSINALHSIIHTLPNDVNYTNKLNKAIEVLREILDRYLEKVVKMAKNDLYENGYNVNTKLIEKGELPYNFDDTAVYKIYSYDIF